MMISNAMLACLPALSSAAHVAASLTHAPLPALQRVPVPHANPTRSNASLEPMLEGTRVLLRDFFAPYNRALAAMLNDRCFAWPDADVDAPKCLTDGAYLVGSSL